MVSRRELLTGAGCAALGCAAPAPRIRADDGFTVLRAAADGFDGLRPGPVIRVRRGAEVKVRLVNGLEQPTAVHWHGVRLPNPMDGAPPLTQAAVAPGSSFDCRFIVPDAGTFWYHAAAGAADGLYGALIVDEIEPPPFDRDHLVVFADGPTVNGAARLDLAARTGERLRLRFLNASSTLMRARIADHGVTVVALDGQPAEPFAPRDGVVVLGPGNRADVVVDAALAPGSVAAITFDTDAAQARIVYEDTGPARAAIAGVAALPANPLPARMNLQTARRATLALGGRPDPRPLLSAERGRTVVMALDNRRDSARAVHLHGHAFRLLDRLDDGWKPYWLDTLLVPPGDTARIAFVADNPGRWRIEDRPLGSPAADGAWFQVA